MTTKPPWMLDLEGQYDTYDDIFSFDHPEDAVVERTEEALRTSPARFLSDMRILFRNRVRCGTNRELWAHVAALDLFFKDNGLNDALVELLSDGDMFDEHPRYIHILLCVIKEVVDLNTNEVCQHKDYDPSAAFRGYQVVSVDSRIAQMLADMCCALWTHKDQMIDRHTNDQFFERSAKRLCYHFWDMTIGFRWSIVLNSPGFHREGLLAFRRLLILLWMRESQADEPTYELLLLILGETFYIEHPLNLDVMGDAAVAFLKKELCDCYEPAAILERLGGTFRFRAPDEFEGQMAPKILWLAQIILIQPCVFPYIGSSRVFEHMIAAIDEHAASTAVARVGWKSRRYLLTTVGSVTGEAPFSQGADPLIRQGVVRLLARSAMDAAYSSNISATDNQMSWDVWVDAVNQYIAMSGVLHFRQQTAPNKDNKPKRSTLLKLFEKEMRTFWYPTLFALRAVPHSEQKAALVDGWFDFGRLMGLVESDERAVFERERKMYCSWRACEYHVRKAQSGMRVCAGCGEVRYCSRPCQQKDWKEGKHKDVCKRLKDAPHVPRATT
ncbi:unnamed protein product [Peniophora sp. CBMAI 1063]|nr:unnamed protein product [Peniophora sp. CBMAI 1063]